MGQPGVMIYFDLRPCLKRLSLEEKGKLLEAILDYAGDGLLPEFDGALGVAWDFIAQRVDADAARYQAKCEQSKAAALSRWGKHGAAVCGRIPPDADCAKDNINHNSTPTTATATTSTSTTPSTTNDGVRKVAEYYRSQVRRALPPTARDELSAYVAVMGADVCLLAIDTALDNGKTSWPYIRGVLDKKRAQGVSSPDDWHRVEQERDSGDGDYWTV